MTMSKRSDQVAQQVEEKGKTSPGREEADATVIDKLHDKIKSKMDVAKFFTGFITLLIGFLLNEESKITPPALKLGSSY